MNKQMKYNHPDSGHPELFTFEDLGEAPHVEASRPKLPPTGLCGGSGDDLGAVAFMSFGSGSSGNCCYIGDRRSGFLIDAGVDGAKVESTLKAEGIPMTAVKAVLLTHDHGDHVRYIYSLLRNNRHLMVYCTKRVMNGMLRRHSISRRVQDYHRCIYKEFEYQIGNFTITPFEVMHDGSENCAFHIRHGNWTMAVATDLGCISPRVDHYFTGLDAMMIESNYDALMLRNGPYPDYLKARIAADHGHLDNADSAALVAAKWHPALTHVFLCHLSNDNNTPELALEQHRSTLLAAHPHLTIGDGSQEHLSQLSLLALPRFEATRLFILRKKTV